MFLEMQIKNIKSIKNFEMKLPLQQGLYALTGENGSGKSTILACAATAFYNPLMYSYFGVPYDGSKIEFTLDENKRVVTSSGNRWHNASGNLYITGFYEGSLIYGNRFKDVDFSRLKTLASVDEKALLPATSFIKNNLGKILHDDPYYYDNLHILRLEKTKKFALLKQPYYYKVNGVLVNQLSMSTGENLLLSILQSLEIRISRRSRSITPTLILLDEIELAFHSSALRRLVYFLDEMACEHNFTIYFSTHSIELIRGIVPDNIHYLQKHVDGTLEIVTPCYPVYATRNLESSNYGHDYIIMVEDNLAKSIVEKILYSKKLLGNKRVLVIAIGGWTEVIRFAYDTIRSNLTLSTTQILIILDRDIKDDSLSFMKKERIGFTNPPNYLPIKSLEKFMLVNLIQQVDINLFHKLNNYLFQSKSLTEITQTYINKEKRKEYLEERVKNGKAFFEEIQHELRNIRKTENDLSQIVVDYLFENGNSEIEELTKFLNDKLS